MTYTLIGEFFMKKIFLLISIFSLVFLFLYLTPIFGKSSAQKTLQFCQAIIPAEIMSFTKNPFSNKYHNVKNTETNFNIYNTPDDYSPKDVDQRENVLVILDCSYSMDDKVRGNRKIDIARDVINDV